jgi:hypothetical protein
MKKSEGELKTGSGLNSRELYSRSDNMPFSITFSYFVKSEKVWREYTIKMKKNSDLFKLADHFCELLGKLKIPYDVIRTARKV